MLQHNYIYIPILQTDFPRKGRQPGFEICTIQTHQPLPSLQRYVVRPKMKEHFIFQLLGRTGILFISATRR